MITTKICGITNLEDALIACKYGVNALGFIFYDKSPRYIDSDSLEKWIFKLPNDVAKVGVFVNHETNYVNNIVEKLSIDYVQLHGNESFEYCKEINRPVIKAFRINEEFDFSLLQDYNVHAFLFDTFKNGKMGGTGNTFDWELLANNDAKTFVILSGGLNNSNILDGICKINPSAVDINSGVEIEPGKKDSEKIFQIMNTLKKSKTTNNIFNGN